MKYVKAKKHLGQHFLNDSNIALRITNLLNSKTKNILEVGPGMGALTQFLIKKKYNLKVVELDKESISYLNLKYPNLKIYEGDILKLNLKKKFPFNFSLIGNFPYNISSQILFKVFENKNQINEVVGMFQKEVAERIVATKGKKKGILSIFLQSYYNIKYCFTVDKNVFQPVPKVESAIIKLERNNRKILKVDEKKFMQLVKSAYNQRRKTLNNALKGFTITNKEKITSLLTLRAEQLSVDDFINLTNYVE